MIYSRVLKTFKISSNNKDLPPLSIIVSAENEAENLKQFLPLILKQNYPDFELIVVNDCSNDGTDKVLAEFQLMYKNLNVIEIEKKNPNISGKKNALTKAISQAKNEYLVFTDADCYPISEKWLYRIAETYSQKTDIIIGYGGYEKRKGFLNKLIRYETLFNAMQYMSFALCGIPYMGVGRNLSYKKSIFIKNNGFSEHKKLISGDDDLFVNAVSNKKNAMVLVDYESITVSIPKNRFKDYLKQKRRHLSTGKYYKKLHKFLLGTEVMSRFFFYAGFLFSIFITEDILIIILLFILRMSVVIILIKLFSGKLKEKNNLFFIPIFDILIPVLNLIIYTGIVSNKKIVWK